MRVREAQTVCGGFMGIINESKHKPNKLWVGQWGQFYNKLNAKMVRR